MHGRKSSYSRRAVYRRKNMVVLISSLCIAIALAILFGSFLSKAETKASGSHLLQVLYEREGRVLATRYGAWQRFIWTRIMPPETSISGK